jgi:hypothetical protein
MAGPRIDPRLRAELKEKARTIISRDRAARKHGWSQNTIGEIERALVDAFILGRDGGEPVFAAQPKDRLDWEEIPPRGRSLLTSLSFRPGPEGPHTPIGVRRLIVDGRERWAIVRANGDLEDRTVASGSVNPLLRLKLLIVSDDDPDFASMTELGSRSCAQYWRRREENDPYLPKESLRH